MTRGRHGPDHRRLARREQRDLHGDTVGPDGRDAREPLPRRPRPSPTTTPSPRRLGSPIRHRQLRAAPRTSRSASPRRAARRSRSTTRRSTARRPRAATTRPKSTRTSRSTPGDQRHDLDRHDRGCGSRVDRELHGQPQQRHKRHAHATPRRTATINDDDSAPTVTIGDPAPVTEGIVSGELPGDVVECGSGGGDDHVDDDGWFGGGAG